MLWCQHVACLISQELNWLPRMVLALTVKEPSKKGPKFAGPAAAVLHLYPRFHLDLASRLGTYPLHQVWIPHASNLASCIPCSAACHPQACSQCRC